MLQPSSFILLMAHAELKLLEAATMRVQTEKIPEAK